MSMGVYVRGIGIIWHNVLGKRDAFGLWRGTERRPWQRRTAPTHPPREDLAVEGRDRDGPGPVQPNARRVPLPKHRIEAYEELGLWGVGDEGEGGSHRTE